MPPPVKSCTSRSRTGSSGCPAGSAEPTWRAIPVVRAGRQRFSNLPLEPDVIFAPLPMIVILKPNTSKEQVEEVVQEVQKLGYTPHLIYGALQTVTAPI